MSNNEGNQLLFITNNYKNGKELNKLPINSIKIQCTNNNNNNNSNSNNNTFKNSYLLKNYSLYPTNEDMTKKEYNQFLIHSNINTTVYPSKYKNEKSDLDDSLDQISQILNISKNNLNYSGFIKKIPGINEESNFVYDQYIFNKSSINKAKKLSNKIRFLKLPISNIIQKKNLNNSNSDKKNIYNKEQNKNNINDNNNNKKNNIDDNAGIFCCFFSKK